MSLVPYPNTPKIPARQPLSRERIVQVAMALLEKEGLDGLTMRTLASALAVQAPSLYRHVRDKQELLVLLADEISAGVPSVPEQGSWQDRVRAMADGVRRALLARRDAARVLAETPPMGPRRLQKVEAVLGLFLAAGFSAPDAVAAAYHLNNLVTELVNDEARVIQMAAAAGVERGQVMADLGRIYRELPAQRFPVLIALAGELGQDDFDGLFRRGLDIWLDGLERCLERARRPEKG